MEFLNKIREKLDKPTNNLFIYLNCKKLPILACFLLNTSNNWQIGNVAGGRGCLKHPGLCLDWRGSALSRRLTESLTARIVRRPDAPRRRKADEKQDENNI